jgi:single-strand DNA-binding protein
MATFVAQGKLSKEPKMQYTPQGTALTFLSLPVHSGYGDNRKTTWVSVSVFGKQAEACNQYLSKGSEVFVTGEIGEISTFEKSDGSTGAELRVKAHQVDFLSKAEKKDDTFEPEEF